MYATAPAIVALFNPTVGMLWLIAGRMVTGFGSGMSVATQAFFATQTPIAERTECKKAMLSRFGAVCHANPKSVTIADMGYNRTFVSSDISAWLARFFVRAPAQPPPLTALAPFQR